MFVVQCGAGKSCPQFYRFVVINLMLALMASVEECN